ncbi:MAG: hypothetical protein IJS46_06515, partial [Kiritimatiellae bacterium]|nr:hypothetical protein [Kiritimatiellia bacterium]
RRKETKPRPRFNEASLVRELERNGIGRPSTFAATIATLKNRKYVESRSRVLSPTPLGVAVADYLVSRFPELLDVAFTAKMESMLDEVEDPEKALDWQDMLADFNARLQGWLKAARGPAADPECLRAVLAEFLKVSKWAEPRRVGKRTYDDKAFVQDIANDFCGIARTKASARRAGEPYAFNPEAGGGGAEITGRQLDALLGILAGYRDQIPGLEAFFYSIGRKDAFKKAAGACGAPAADPRIAGIFAFIEKAGVPARATAFFASLKAQFEAGRSLSPRQVEVLENMFREAGASQPGWSPETCERMGVAWKDAEEENPELAADLVAALGRVGKWAEPVKRGARTFDDRAFYVSLASQFGTRGHLSAKQTAALSKMFLRYFDQVPDAAAIAAKHGIARRAKKGAGSAGESGEAK